MLTIKPNVQLKHQDNLSFGCRDGYCGQCRATLHSGQVKLISEPVAMLGKDEILPCCCETVTEIVLEQHGGE
ncbi:hypothetical protein TUM3794_19860 [Shewanella colwelliana]|uniref:2Fe-2S ferredoxin-type domain-containing protein n=1 Tax=Shewanella colwelliana TaxID=23 RepID=A0ABQ4P087_SHECO|nr:2Fe-2S iron-sulfur cluster-binding protein [Shewanella colwelliana]GIU40881.1 hypothetical protein TUM3794_19860 [Shewanella colwelliana]